MILCSPSLYVIHWNKQKLHILDFNVAHELCMIELPFLTLTYLDLKKNDNHINMWFYPYRKSPSLYKRRHWQLDLSLFQDILIKKSSWIVYSVIFPMWIIQFPDSGKYQDSPSVSSLYLGMPDMWVWRADLRDRQWHWQNPGSRWQVQKNLRTFRDSI